MNKTKHIFILFLLISSVVSNSCNKKEGCTNPKAENFDPSAEREDGSCIGQRAKFLGLYEVTEQCGNTQITPSYLVEVKASNINLDDILIFNLSKDLENLDVVPDNFNFEFPLVATIVNSRFTFDKQAPDGDGWYIQEGKGEIIGNEINFNYKIKYGDGVNPLPNSCNIVMRK